VARHRSTTVTKAWIRPRGPAISWALKYRGQALLAMVLPAFSANSASLRFIASPLP
jgi:hypothetical protein